MKGSQISISIRTGELDPTVSSSGVMAARDGVI